jgi:hypothetical protein
MLNTTENAGLCVQRSVKDVTNNTQKETPLAEYFVFHLRLLHQNT